MSTLLSIETLGSNEECSIFALTRALTWGIYGEKKSCRQQPLSGQRLPLSTQVLLFCPGRARCASLHVACASTNAWWEQHYTLQVGKYDFFPPPAKLSSLVTWNLALKCCCRSSQPEELDHQCTKLECGN